MSNKWLIIIIIAAGLLTRFLFFGHPNQTVFDEVHFGKFISSYYTHEYYFDIHPPLGKMIIAGFGKLFNFKPEFSFAEIGESFPDNKYMALRFLPALAGSLLGLTIFLLALELGFSKIASFSAGALISIENALIVQSHYILLDGFLLLFGFLALLFYFRSTRNQRLKTRNLIFMAIFGGLAISIKWTGLTFLALPGLIELVNFIKSRDYIRFIKFCLTLVIAFIIYFSVFAIHFALLPKSGQGDAFMSPAFQKTLSSNYYQNDPTIKPINLWHKFVELNVEMYQANATLTATHPYSSKWYTWPFMIRPIYYWVNSAPATASGIERIYLIGNPVIWWASTVALLMLALTMLRNFKFTIFNFQINTEVILITGYILNLLPFIGIERVMFLYHYLTALIFAILILAYSIDKMKNKKIIFSALILASLAAFIYFAPLTYGLRLTDKQYENRIWLSTWK